MAKNRENYYSRQFLKLRGSSSLMSMQALKTGTPTVAPSVYIPHSISQLLILDLCAEEVRVGRLVAHGGGERAEDGVQELEHLVLVGSLPAVPRRLAQRTLHGHQQRGDVHEAAHLAEDGPGAVALPQHR